MRKRLYNARLQEPVAQHNAKPNTRIFVSDFVRLLLSQSALFVSSCLLCCNCFVCDVLCVFRIFQSIQSQNLLKLCMLMAFTLQNINQLKKKISVNTRLPSITTWLLKDKNLSSNSNKYLVQYIEC